MTVEPEQDPWWRRAVIYQIYPRSFQDSNGDGIGDLAGIVGRLDHLVWLGVDALWLTPFFASPMEDGGYDISGYTDVAPVFGTVDDARALITAAHERGLRVIFDLVPNHTSHRHPWFVAARSGRDDPHRDWYLWRDPAPDGGPPNNWRSVTDNDRPGSAWILDEASGQYYLATFSSVQPDLNWANPEVREALRDVMRFWLDRGVDGFRVDMVGFLGKDPEFRDEPDPADPAAHNYLVDSRRHLNRPETLEYLRELRKVVDAYPDRVLIGEMLYHAPVDLLASYVAEAGIDLPTNFSLITLPLEPERIAEHVDAYDAALRAVDGWPNYCLGNHDMPRVSAHGPERARLALTLLLTLRGTPFLYYGDEIGMANVEVPPGRRDDRWTTPQRGLSRDAVRTPMQWDDGHNAGFCPPDVEPWLPIPDDHALVNVASQSADERSPLHLVRRLLTLRREEPALAVGGYRRLPDTPAGCLAYDREHAGRTMTVVLNFADEAVAVDVGAAAGGARPGRAGSAPVPPHVVLETLDGAARVAGGTLHLAPRAGAVLAHE